MGKAVGYTVLILSALLTNLYLLGMAGAYGYFAWGVDHSERCYGYTKNKDVVEPSITEGPDLHDVTKDFQIINNYGAIVFFILFLGYFVMTLTRNIGAFTIMCYTLGGFAWLVFFIMA